MSIKSRKLFAILVVAMMILTLLPLTAFAASTNSVDRVVTVTKNHDLSTLIKTPQLSIKNKDNSFSDEEVFRLQLPDTAKWNDGLESGIKFENSTNAGIKKLTKINDQIVQIEVYNNDTSIHKDFTIKVPMNVKLKDASGEQKVNVINWDSAISDTSHAFAIVESGKTVAKVGEKKTIRRACSTGASIVLDETMAGALEEGDQEFRMRLPWF